MYTLGQKQVEKVREHQGVELRERARNYETTNQPKYSVGDIVRRMVARSGKLDAAWSKRLYKVIRVKTYKTMRPAGSQIAPTNAPNTCLI